MFGLSAMQGLQLPNALSIARRGMCKLIKLPTQRLPTKKSIADLEEGENEYVDNRPSPLADIEERIEKSKLKLRWRTPPTENKAVWFSKLRAFAPERRNVDAMLRRNQIKFSPKNFFKFRRQTQLAYDMFLQSFIVERHKILGNDLATAHFLVHRGASVKYDRHR